jgi:hypothetical protein
VRSRPQGSPAKKSWLLTFEPALPVASQINVEAVHVPLGLPSAEIAHCLTHLVPLDHSIEWSGRTNPSAL